MKMATTAVAEFRAFGMKAVPYSPPDVFMKTTKAGGRYKSARKNPALVEWQLYVAEFAKSAMAGLPLTTRPVFADLEFSVKTEKRVLHGLVCSPAIVFNEAKQAWVKKVEGVADVDNLAKGVLDAMQGIVFADDVQVCGLKSVRVYGPDDAVRVRVWGIDEQGE